MKNHFHEVMLRRNELLHRLAIWQEVVDHLTKFLDTDAVPASVGIRTEGGGMVVPQDRIEAVLGEIKRGFMAEIDGELDRINNSEVSEDVKKDKNKKVSRKGKKVAAVKSKSKQTKRKAGARK